MTDGDITVDGKAFNVERVARGKTDVWFELTISVEESRKGTPKHVFKKILEPGGRSDLTDEYIQSVLRQWAESHPEYTINGFGISEGRVARNGFPVDTNDNS
jgi:hypothetical protein